MARLGLVVLADGRPNQHQWVLRHNPKQQNLLHYAFQPLGQRFFYDQTFLRTAVQKFATEVAGLSCCGQSKTLPL
jgi:hypothetical protein